MRSEQEVNRAIECYADTVKRICILHLKNVSDTEDIFQEVFLKYAMSDIVFENEEHEKDLFTHFRHSIYFSSTGSTYIETDDL